MVNAICTIPLPGRSSDTSSAAADAGPLAEFIAGPENYLAATALQPYLEKHPTHYSPLLLYGPHGSGKSHLARGLVGWWQQHYPTLAVACLAGSEFAQAYAGALASGSLVAWRRQLRRSSLVVIEDIGQLAGKEPAQTELANTLDASPCASIVVLTSVTLATHADWLIPSLASRLSAGLAVPLALPGLEARQAILERLIATRQLSVPEQVVPSLAQGLPLGVPALNAALVELELAARCDGVAVDHAQVQQYVATQQTAKMPGLRESALATAKYFGLRLSDLKSPSRQQPLVAARGAAMYLARQLTEAKLGQIGAFFGGRDHTTVLHGCRRTEKLLKRDAATRQAIADLKNTLSPV